MVLEKMWLKVSKERSWHKSKVELRARPKGRERCEVSTLTNLEEVDAKEVLVRGGVHQVFDDRSKERLVRVADVLGLG